MNPAKATLVMSSHQHVHTVLTLGDLQSVHVRNIWHDTHAAATLHFKHARAETSVAELYRIARMCRAALIAPRPEVDLAGIFTDLDNGEVW